MKSLTAGLLTLMVSITANAENCSQIIEKILANNERKLQPLTHNEIERLDIFINKLSSNQQSQLFDLLSSSEMQGFILKLESGEIDQITLEQNLKQYPGIEELVLDFVKFGELYPGIFNGANRLTMVPRIIGFLKNDGSKKVLASLVEARTKSSGFRYSAIQSTTATIRNAIDDYKGLTYNVGRWERLGQRISRYFFPLHGKAQEIVDFTHHNLKQSERMLAVDKVIVEAGINQAEKYGLDDQALAKLTYFIGDTVEDLHDMVKVNRAVFGDEFDYNDAVYIHKTNIYNVNNRLSKIDQSDLMEDHDMGNLSSLYQMNEILEKAQGKTRTMKQYDDLELKLLYGGQHRQTYRYEHKYKNITSETSNESYSVTDKHVYYVTEGTGKDAKQVRKERFETRTIYPTFEDILTNSYTTGNYSTSSHLYTIKERVADMVETERPIRELTDTADSLVQEIEDKFSKLVTSIEEKNKYSQALSDLHAQIQLKLAFMQKYANWKKADIKTQYSEDDVENFQRRNKALLNRIINLEKQIRVTQELLDRNTPSPYMTFESPWSFEHWMEILKSHRNKNYALKSIQATSAATATGFYFYNEDFQDQVDTWANDGVKAFKELLDLQEK